MKTSIKLLLAFLLLFGATAVSAQTTNVFYISLTKELISTYDEDESRDNIKHRIPSRPITATIDWESMTLIIPDVSTDDIIEAELWLDDNCILSTSDISTLLEVLQGVDEEVTICLRTEEYEYTGVYNP